MFRKFKIWAWHCQMSDKAIVFVPILHGDNGIFTLKNSFLIVPSFLQRR